MKKIYSVLIVTGLSFSVSAQLIDLEPRRAIDQNTFTTIPVHEPASDFSAEDRAPGDVIWANDFSFASNWLVTGPVGSGPDNNWIIGTGTTTWYLGAWSASTSGGPYATCKNGDPGDGVPPYLSGGEFIMEYDTIFDLSSYANVLIEFEQRGAHFNDDQWVQVSTNGVTWTTVYDNAKYPGLYYGAGKSYPNPDFVQADITSAIAASPSTVQIRFILSWDAAITTPGIAYGWMIDDVKLREAYDYDVNIGDATILTGAWPSAVSQVPTYMVQDISFTAEAVNGGNNALTDAIATVTVSGTAYSGTSTAVNIPYGVEDSLIVTAPFSPPTSTGNHTVTYTLSSADALENTYNDDVTRNLKITADMMASDYFDGTNGSISNTFFGWGAPTGSVTCIGNMIEVAANEHIVGMEVGIRDYNSTSSSEGLAIWGRIVKFDGSAFDFDGSFTTDEFYVDASDVGELMELYFHEAPLEVFAGETYLVASCSYTGDEVGVMTSGRAPVGTSIGLDDDDWFSVTWDDEGEMAEIPVVRTLFATDGSTGSEANNAFTIHQNVPNPFNDNTIVSYTLNETSNVSVKITDISGKVYDEINRGEQTSGTYQIELNAKNYAQGTYFYTFTIGDRKYTKKMTVIK